MEGSIESAEESADGAEGNAESIEASAEKHVGRAFRRDEKLPKSHRLRKFAF